MKMFNYFIALFDGEEIDKSPSWKSTPLKKKTSGIYAWFKEGIMGDLMDKNKGTYVKEHAHSREASFGSFKWAICYGMDTWQQGII